MVEDYTTHVAMLYSDYKGSLLTKQYFMECHKGLVHAAQMDEGHYDRVSGGK